ncbi:hypothetical protein [Mucilaginibacter inviolabilis]|uniref:hypothetical protein n=1 Tax=Mucilaginibacter inviolabilis TaxID=2714892 RepID=UPI001407ADCF|nr:hypothetical protein [Mucilaginibacter inviolabilis]
MKLERWVMMVPITGIGASLAILKANRWVAETAGAYIPVIMCNSIFLRGNYSSK